MWRTGIGAAALLVLMGCGEVSPHPPGPEGGVQLVTPEIVVQPGEEVMKCWYTTIPEGLDWIVAMQSVQSAGGHHVIGFTTDETYEEVPDGAVIDCIEADAMARYIPLLTPTLSHGEEDRVDLPDGLALRMRVGSRLVLQSHYINTSKSTIRTRDEVNLWAADDAPDRRPAAPYMTQSFDHVIPTGGIHSLAYSCPVDDDINIHSVVGHMHEQGSSIRILAGAAPDLEEIYRVAAWEDGFRDSPPMKEWPLDAPLALSAGDSLRVECTWDTSLALQEVTFPEEMCASLFWMYPLDEPLFCAGVE